MFSQVCIFSVNDISREGLAQIARAEGFDVVGTFSNVKQMEASGLDLLAIIDEPDPALQSKVVEEVKAHLPNSLPVILSEEINMEAMAACFRVGAAGYILKSMRSHPMMIALRLAAHGEKVLPSDLVDFLGSGQPLQVPCNDWETAAEAADLSKRELDVLCLLMAGLPNKLIARNLDIGEATVKVHVKSILRKLKVTNRTQAAIWANANGLANGDFESV